MQLKHFMPVRVLMGPDIIRQQAPLLAPLGTTALIVTGRSSARASGALADIIAALDSQGIRHILFDQVEANPRLATVRQAAQLARQEKAGFVVGIGGGSPLDAAKAVALLAVNDLDDSAIFTGPWPGGALKLVAVPTTAGTGSEVTQYAILTNDALQTKTSIAWDGLFPAIAFLDSRYTHSCPLNTTINTALDALSHAVEGFLSNKSDPWSRSEALEAIRLLGKNLQTLARLPAGELPGPDTRAELLFAANLAGVVISQTGSTMVHAMGYPLTYSHGVDHGRANALLLPDYLDFIARQHPGAVQTVLDAFGACQSPDLHGPASPALAFRQLLDRLLGPRERLSPEEITQFARTAIQARNIANTLVVPTLQDLQALYAASLG